MDVSNFNHNVSNTNNSSNDHNAIGSILTFLGVIILIIGTIASYIMSGGGSRYYSSNNVTIFIVYEFATLLFGFVIIGFAQILHLLQRICNKL